MGRVLCRRCKSIVIGLSRIILHVYASDAAILNKRREKAMLVPVVDLVNGPDGNIPSIVGLYFLYDELVKSNAKSIYFSPLQRSFKFIDGLADGKLGGIVDDSGRCPLQDFSPSIVESASQIVSGIPDHQCDVGSGLSIGQVVLDAFISTCRIDFNNGGTAVWQSCDALFKIGDMLFGPFNL